MNNTGTNERNTEVNYYQGFQKICGSDTAKDLAGATYLICELSWSHYIVLLGISDDISRKFYEKQSIYENWSKRELEKQVDSSLFERLALSKDKKGVFVYILL